MKRRSAGAGCHAPGILGIGHLILIDLVGIQVNGVQGEFI